MLGGGSRQVTGGGICARLAVPSLQASLYSLQCFFVQSTLC
jgi:hypothetical protein